MRDLKKKLGELWAKSDGTTIRDHTDTLIRNLKNLKEMYGDLIERACPEEFRGILWEALRLACEYHDYGKMHSHFQRKVGNKKVKPPRELPEVRHNLLSPAFIDGVEDRFLKDIVSLAIIHHHDHDPLTLDDNKVEKVLREEFGLELRYRRLLMEHEESVLRRLSRKYGRKEENLKRFYILLKGLLLRIDHASSSREFPKVETTRLKDPEVHVEDYLKREKDSDLNELQRFVLENRDRNILVLASTGYGKTEAGFVFLKDKGIFTIPIRTSANAIYERARNVFGEENVGLLHSTSLSAQASMLCEEKRARPESLILDYYISRNFGKFLIVSTPDQIFPFVFGFSGFEKFLALLSYSRVVVDEVQLFEPHTLGFIVKAVEKIKEMGGKVMIMTATLPPFVREDLESLEFVEGRFFTEKVRHNIKVVKGSIVDFADRIKRLGEEGKVLVITNTVNRAIELKKVIEDARLLHAHFIWWDRKEKEKDIKEFFDESGKGIWITTQIAEVSLDLDADFLVTELSTIDSLVQRMGRVNRKGKREADEPNVFVITEDCSGIGPVYRKVIHEETKKVLRDGKVTEEEKVCMIEKVYESVVRKDQDYLNRYKTAKDYIENLWKLEGYRVNKNMAQELFRDIKDSVTVIPYVFRDEVETILEEFRNAKSTEERIMKFGEILEYTFTMRRQKGLSLEGVNGLKGIYFVRGDYDRELGFIPSSERKVNIV